MDTSAQLQNEQPGNDHLAVMQQLAGRMADYIALFEEAAQKIEQHEVLTGKRLEASENYFNARVQEVKKATQEIQDIMTQAGAARWRVAAEHALNQGKAHVDELHRTTSTFERMVQDNCQRVQVAADEASNRMQETLKNLHIDEFRQAVQDNVIYLEQSTQKVSKRMSGWMKWFQWQKLGIALVVAIGVSFLTAMFVNDEFPWESHAKAATERDAGRMLLAAWPQLTMNEQHDIRRDAQNRFV